MCKASIAFSRHSLGLPASKTLKFMITRLIMTPFFAVVGLTVLEKKGVQAIGY